MDEGSAASSASPDDTAAFQRFYAGDAPAPAKQGLLYRLLIGWWRDRG